MPLFVDLDGTLIKSDITVESMLLVLKRNIFYLPLIAFWLLRGRPYLKRQLARRVEVPVERLPLNTEFLNYLRGEKAKGRKLILISASDQTLVRKVGDHIGLFDDSIGSDGHFNLKAGNKLRRIRQLTTGDFAYAGNSTADLPIWSAAQHALMVNCDDKLVKRLGGGDKAVSRFDQPESVLLKLWHAMRPHQWLKNLLLFVPLVLSHQLDQTGMLLMAVIGFISFSLCASSVYLLNDLLDLDSDRLHDSKHRRPFAAGELPLSTGLVAAPVLLSVAFAVALLLPPAFLYILFLYWLLTCCYSFFLKRLFLVDVALLAMLYTIRIIAGSAAISVASTDFLVAFSLFLFLGLALVKRVTELGRLAASNKVAIEGRAYSERHLRLLSIIGSGSSLISVLIFIFYINAPDTTRLYSSPQVLWLICLLLVYLLARIWRQARTGKLDEDPVLFAITDRASQFIALLCGVLIWLAI